MLVKAFPLAVAAVLAAPTDASAITEFLDLVGEQGFISVGDDSGSGNPHNLGVYKPETGTRDQMRLCHVLSSSGYPDDQPVLRLIVTYTFRPLL